MITNSPNTFKIRKKIMKGLDILEGKNFSIEEKDAVINYCSEEIEWYFANIDNRACWCYIVTEDPYMREEIRKRILGIDPKVVKSELPFVEIIEFDGIKHLNDDSMLLKIVQAALDKNKILLLTHLKEYDKYCFDELQKNGTIISDHPFFSQINFKRDAIFNEEETRIIFLLSREEDITFMKYAIDFYTQIDFVCDMDYVLSNREEYYIKTESEQISERKILQ